MYASRLVNVLRIVTPSCADVIKLIESEPWDPYEMRESTKQEIEMEFQMLNTLIDLWADTEPTRRYGPRVVPSSSSWKDIEDEIQRTAYRIMHTLSIECDYLQQTHPTLGVCMHVRDASYVLMYIWNENVNERIVFGWKHMGFRYVVEDAPVAEVDTSGLRSVFDQYVMAYDMGGPAAVFTLQMSRYRAYIAHLQSKRLDVDQPKSKTILHRAYPSYPKRAKSHKKVAFIEGAEAHSE